MNRSWWQQFEGQVIDNTYHLSRLLGIGGFGAVFLADHRVEGALMRQVAVKLVVSDTDQISRQLAELSIATTVHHPALLSCYHAGAAGLSGMRVLYLVMEPAQESLQNRLERGIVPAWEAVGLTRSITEALNYLHQHRRVHRDVKPANILAVENLWKLSDFGTVRQSSENTSHTGLILGTMTYMPPESFDGTVSPAWDMWSVGVVLLRALTGQPAYAETSEHQLMHAILTREPAIPLDLPEPFGQIVRGCLIKDHHQRWSADKLIGVLDRATREPVRAVTSVETPRTMPEPIFATGPAPARMPTQPLNDPWPAAAPSLVVNSPSRPGWLLPVLVCVAVVLLAAGAYVLMLPSHADKPVSASNEPAPQSTVQPRKAAQSEPGPTVAQPPRSVPPIHKKTAAPPSEIPVEKPALPQRIRVGGNVQAANLINRVSPVYPPLAKQARVQGTVRFTAVIAKDGTIQNLQLVSGHPLLVPAAQEAVSQWLYRPTLLEGQPVEVVTTIDVNFTLSQ